DQGAVGSMIISTRNIIRQLLALGVEPDPVRPQGCTSIGDPSCVLFDTFARHPREKMHGTSGQSMPVELVKVRPIESRNYQRLVASAVRTGIAWPMATPLSLPMPQSIRESLESQRLSGLV